MSLCIKLICDHCSTTYLLGETTDRAFARSAGWIRKRGTDLRLKDYCPECAERIAEAAQMKGEAPNANPP